MSHIVTHRFGRFQFYLATRNIIGVRHKPYDGIDYGAKNFMPMQIIVGQGFPTSCLLRPFRTLKIRARILWISTTIVITPKDVWEHWQELKRAAGKK